jgi:hypothetical protein
MAKDIPEVVRPRGRPRVEEPMSSVSTRLPSDAYDRLIRAANQQDKSVSSLVRQLLILRLPTR